jgi:hypothetical protein
VEVLAECVVIGIEIGEFEALNDAADGRRQRRPT